MGTATTAWRLWNWSTRSDTVRTRPPIPSEVAEAPGAASRSGLRWLLPSPLEVTRRRPCRAGSARTASSTRRACGSGRWAPTPRSGRSAHLVARGAYGHVDVDRLTDHGHARTFLSGLTGPAGNGAYA